MKLQFSLSEMLVCVTVLAVVFAASAIPVPVTLGYYPPGPTDAPVYYRLPRTEEVSRRLPVWGPISFVATLGALWFIRRRYPPNRPPVG